MRKFLIVIGMAALLSIAGATAASAGNGPFPGLMKSGKPTNMVSTITANGLAISLKLDANVKDGGDSPFWLRIRRVSGNSSPYLVAAMAFSFDHSSKLWTASYTVPNGSVVFSLRAPKKKAQDASANSSSSSGTKKSSGVSGSVHSNGAGASEMKLVNHPTNLQFADPKGTLMRIGQLKIGEYVSISGTVHIEKRSDWGANKALFFRLHAGVSQVSPDDTGWPTPTWSLTASSLY